jgi:hypothetical protein
MSGDSPHGQHIFLLPLAVPRPESIDCAPPQMIARRLPAFWCDVLNADQPDRLALMEMRYDTGQGRGSEWLTLDRAPQADEVFGLLPGPMPAVAVVGTLDGSHDGLALELEVLSSVGGEPLRLGATMRLSDPAGDGLALARRLARALGLPIPGLSWHRLGTKDGPAFWSYLQGLDEVATLESGEVIAEPLDSPQPGRFVRPALKQRPDHQGERGDGE